MLCAIIHAPKSQDGASLAPRRCCPSSSYSSPPAASLPRQTYWAGLCPCPPLPGETQAAGVTNSWSRPCWCHQQLVTSLMEPLCCVSAWPHPDPGGPRSPREPRSANGLPLHASTQLKPDKHPREASPPCSLPRSPPACWGPGRKMQLCLPCLFPSEVSVLMHLVSCRAGCRGTAEPNAGTRGSAAGLLVLQAAATS